MKYLRAVITFFLGIAFISSPGFAQANISTKVIKITITASKWDRDLLLKKLNEHGRSHDLGFDITETGYEYRIEFSTRQKPVGMYGINSSASSTTIYDAYGKEIFSFNRAGRATDAGATNAVAKEIIKQLMKIRSEAIP